VKFVDSVCEFGLHLISKLRHDANLRYLFLGPHPKRRGARKKYDGKVNLQDLRRLTPVVLSKTITLYTAVVNSVSLKRNLRLVYVCKRQGTKLLTAVLVSTDTTLSAEAIYRYYTARFQIEFLFRDAKQFTGLTDFQTRSETRITFHVNASLTALNFLKLEDRQQAPEGENHVISIARPVPTSAGKRWVPPPPGAEYESWSPCQPRRRTITHSFTTCSSKAWIACASIAPMTTPQRGCG